ncbi:MAG: hypothetical protein ACKPKO_65210, partial [Candidatus Fonsibacter sp.]
FSQQATATLLGHLPLWTTSHQLFGHITSSIGNVSAYGHKHHSTIGNHQRAERIIKYNNNGNWKKYQLVPSQQLVILRGMMAMLICEKHSQFWSSYNTYNIRCIFR